MTDHEQKELVQWLYSEILPHPMYARLEKLIQDRIDNSITEVINCEDDMPHKRGRIVGMTECLNIPRDLISELETEGTVEKP